MSPKRWWFKIPSKTLQTRATSTSCTAVYGRRSLAFDDAVCIINFVFDVASFLCRHFSKLPSEAKSSLFDILCTAVDTIVISVNKSSSTSDSTNHSLPESVRNAMKMSVFLIHFAIMSAEKDGRDQLKGVAGVAAAAAKKVLTP